MNTKTLPKKLAGRFSTYGKVLVHEGLLPCLECIFRQVGGDVLGMSPVGHPRVNLVLYKITDALYDLLHKVDTRGMIDLPEMEGRGRNYVGTPPRAWKLLLKHLPIDPSRVTYVDLGCGKGRTLLLASEMGFGRIIGVDISPQLCRVAQQNLTRRSVRAELVCCDVREFDFPLEPLVLFMYNPFYPDVMLHIAESLRISVRSRPREVYVVYYSAPIRDVWKNLDFGVFRETDYTYPNYVIFRTSAPEPVDVRARLSSIRYS